MDTKQRRQISKLLSLVLRHRPEKIGISLDEAGWTEVNQLLTAFTANGYRVSREQLEEVVTTNDKQRFALSEDGQRIRASQGHSLDVELGYEPRVPPPVLYHGTPQRFVESIRREGLKKMRRHHVHLSASIETAATVGSRRGKPAVLMVQAGQMHEQGHAFFISTNGVWLTESVPALFIEFPEGAV